MKTIWTITKKTLLWILSLFLLIGSHTVFAWDDWRMRRIRRRLAQ